MKTAKIANLNGFRARKALFKAATDPRIAEIEGGGCDEGRVFIHLKRGYWFGPAEKTHSRTVGSGEELKYALRLICPDPAENDCEADYNIRSNGPQMGD